MRVGRALPHPEDAVGFPEAGGAVSAHVLEVLPGGGGFAARVANAMRWDGAAMFSSPVERGLGGQRGRCSPVRGRSRYPGLGGIGKTGVLLSELC